MEVDTPLVVCVFSLFVSLAASSRHTPDSQIGVIDKTSPCSAGDLQQQSQPGRVQILLQPRDLAICMSLHVLHVEWGGERAL